MDSLDNYTTTLTEMSYPKHEVPNSCNTLWIPVYSGNRTATLNLNHEIIGKKIHVPTGEIELFGANGNCGTQYVILEVPDNFTTNHIDELAQLVFDKLGKSELDENGFKYPKFRILKADGRLSIIKEAIKELSL